MYNVQNAKYFSSRGSAPSGQQILSDAICINDCLFEVVFWSTELMDHLEKLRCHSGNSYVAAQIH